MHGPKQAPDDAFFHTTNKHLVGIYRPCLIQFSGASSKMSLIYCPEHETRVRSRVCAGAPQTENRRCQSLFK